MSRLEGLPSAAMNVSYDNTITETTELVECVSTH